MLIALRFTSRLVLGGADVDADAAPGAVVGRDLDRELMAVEFARAERLRQEAVGRAGERLGLVGLHPDGRVRADDGALAAVDAQVGFPDRDLGASLRFSYVVVPVGNVPSTGIADTGSRSPLPAIIAS